MIIDGSLDPETKRKLGDQVSAIKELVGPGTRVNLQLRYLVEHEETKDGVTTRHVPFWWMFYIRDVDFDDELPEGRTALLPE